MFDANETGTLTEQLHEHHSITDLGANTTWALVFVCSLATTLCGMELMFTNGNIIYMVGSIGITPDESTWILAAFFAAQLIGISLCSTLWRALTVRNYLLCMSVLYIIFEVMAAQSHEAIMFTLSRFGAGFVNGNLTAITLILIMRKIPSERRLLTYFFFGTPPILTVPIAFILGGVFINDTSWRDIYYFSAFLCLLLGIGFYSFARPQRMRPQLAWRIDPIGLLLFIVCAAVFTIAMMRATTENWIDSPFIQMLFGVNVVAWSLLFIQQCCCAKPLIDFKLCKDPHFIAMIMINFVFGTILAYTIVIAGFLVLTQDYDSTQIGIAVALAAVTVPFPMAWQKRVDLRIILLAGIFCFTISGLINANVTRLEDASNIILSQVIRSIGQTFLLWPLWGLTILSVKEKDYENAAKIYTFSRVIGIVSGIAAVGAFQTWRNNFHSVHVMETLNDAVIKSDLAQYKQFFLGQGSTYPMAAKQALGLVVKHTRAENTTLAYGDLFWLIGGISVIAAIPLFFVRGTKSPRSLADHFISLFAR
ncbi:MAG TPA: MFS transporter [Trichormus sp.]